MKRTATPIRHAPLAMAHVLGLAAAAALFAPAPARAAVDCEKLKTTKEPFALVNKVGDKSVAMQVFREGDGVTTALIQAGEVVVKQRFHYGLLTASQRKSPKGDLHMAVESTEKGDPFAGKKTFAYDEKITSTGLPGVPTFDMRFSTEAAYMGEQDVTLSGCTFHVLRYVAATKTSESTLQAGDAGKAQHSQMTLNDKYYSPDLQTVIIYKTHMVVDGKQLNGVSFTPNAIETDFARIKDPGD